MAVDARISEFRLAEQALFTRYGLPVQERSFNLSDPPLSARVLETGSGEPLLLMHGGGACAAFWAPLMAELGGNRLLVPDRPGCGLSGRFNYRGADLRKHAVSFLEGVLDALELPTVRIVANSMGGLWSLWLALDRPTRVSAMVQLGCPALVPDMSTPLPMRLLSVRGLNELLFRLEPPSPAQGRRLLKRMGHSPATITGLPQEFMTASYRMAGLPYYKEGWLTLLENALSLRGPNPRLSLKEDELRRVAQPVLFVWGESDPFGGPDVGRRAVSLMPNAKLEAMPGGHLPWLDDPKFCAEAIKRFFAGLSG